MLFGLNLSSPRTPTLCSTGWRSCTVLSASCVPRISAFTAPANAGGAVFFRERVENQCHQIRRLHLARQRLRVSRRHVCLVRHCVSHSRPSCFEQWVRLPGTPGNRPDKRRPFSFVRPINGLRWGPKGPRVGKPVLPSEVFGLPQHLRKKKVLRRLPGRHAEGA